MVIAELGRYAADPEFQTAQARASVLHGLEQAVRWTEEGKLKHSTQQGVLYIATILSFVIETHTVLQLSECIPPVRFVDCADDSDHVSESVVAVLLE